MTRQPLITALLFIKNALLFIKIALLGFGRWLFISLLIGLLLSGCAHQDAAPPALDEKLAAQANVQIDLLGSEPNAVTSDTNPEVLTHWWQRFDDPLLNTLLESAVDKNVDIAIAYWQWQQNQAQSSVTIAAQRPEISAHLQGNRQRALSQNSDNNNSQASTRRSWNANLQARWQIDLWNKLQHNADAARAQMRASEAVYQGVYLSVLSQVADVYFHWQQVSRQHQLTQHTIELLLSIEKNTEQRFHLGASNRLDWIQAQAERQQQEVALQRLHSEQYALQQQLRLLTSGAAQDLLTDEVNANAAPFTYLNTNQGAIPSVILPKKLQVNLLERRPDIMQAREQLLEAWSTQQATKVAHLPTLDLLAGLGSASRIAGDLFGNNSNTYQLNGDLAAILWQGDRLKAALAAADANSKKHHLAYQRSVLNAIYEVDLHLMQIQQLQKNLQQQQAVNQLQESALDIAKQRYQSGEDDLLNVLTAQRSLYNQQWAFIVADSDLRRALVGLYQSLGGGWPKQH
jgi:multidrug efflux system outer membrane protein